MQILRLRNVLHVSTIFFESKLQDRVQRIVISFFALLKLWQNAGFPYTFRHEFYIFMSNIYWKPIFG